MSGFLERIRRSGSVVALELRPPRADLSRAETMDAWLGMGSAVRRLALGGTPLFFTDNAVGTVEEENLHHLITNLGDDVPRETICPFLTTKHSLEYCLWYADRAVQDGHSALTVLGGDPHVGPPRCVEHAHQLRTKIRGRHPGLALGGWANPYRDAESQAGYLAATDASADFYLTQIVSHHGLGPVQRFVDATRRRQIRIPGIFGVFYYRSANPRTLAMLSRFLTVPAEEIRRDFEERRLSADEVCARSIRGLRDLGVDRVYVSNLRPDDAATRLAAIESLLAG